MCLKEQTWITYWLFHSNPTCISAPATPAVLLRGAQTSRQSSEQHGSFVAHTAQHRLPALSLLGCARHPSLPAWVVQTGTDPTARSPALLLPIQADTAHLHTRPTVIQLPVANCFPWQRSDSTRILQAGPGRCWPCLCQWHTAETLPRQSVLDANCTAPRTFCIHGIKHCSLVFYRRVWFQMQLFESQNVFLFIQSLLITQQIP